MGHLTANNGIFPQELVAIGEYWGGDKCDERFYGCLSGTYTRSLTTLAGICALKSLNGLHNEFLM